MLHEGSAPVKRVMQTKKAKKGNKTLGKGIVAKNRKAREMSHDVKDKSFVSQKILKYGSCARNRIGRTNQRRS